jgi:hypothetical protein
MNPRLIHRYSFFFEIESDDQARAKRVANRPGEIDSSRLGRTVRHTDNHAVNSAIGGMHSKPAQFAVGTFIERPLQAAAGPSCQA